MEELVFQVKKEDSGERVDKFLSVIIEDKSRSFFQGLIEEKNVLVNGKAIKSNYKLKEGDAVLVDIPEPIELTAEAENISLEIVYEDEDVIVVNKPQGMVVHPAVGNYTGTLVNALLFHCRDLSGINGVIRPGIVHRIDKDTSGLLVVAKNDFAHNNLAQQFKDHSINREYYAILEGRLNKDSGTIDAPLARHQTERLKIAVVQGGRRAITHYEVMERYKANTLVKCKLETGRTHQIRVHMAFIGHPLVGDPVYGFKKQRFNLEGQMLHAKILGFIHPTKGKYMEFSSELPNHFIRILEKLRGESL
ncbi:pseudouridine synthase [Clostridium polyendosporum]|uniref:Pseudouridine synthase n=1 Tax=Clostridium polyendosporum TaxID=69208 RepID=A0A919RYB5_9CLOT|nr:RluA family pseudouridine synthase [Clostridium polyendosporum]GIM27971.1 pseudouridine synthase [Clostridium polyendosporum]